MASKTESMLTKSAKKLADKLKKESDLTLKQIMSAGVLAFAELSQDEKLDYLTKSQMGDIKLPDIPEDQFRDQLVRVLSQDPKLLTKLLQDASLAGSHVGESSVSEAERKHKKHAQ